MWNYTITSERITHAALSILDTSVSGIVLVTVFFKPLLVTIQTYNIKSISDKIDD